MTTNVTSGKVLVDGKPAPGIALHGYVAVASFQTGGPVAGDARIALVRGDATYRFSTPANLAAFAANPARYEPQFGGFCAYGAAVGAKFDHPVLLGIADAVGENGSAVLSGNGTGEQFGGIVAELPGF